jgi:class 3 adenylate cyclase/tetratricopeptide (TPR) repeat protein
MATESVTVLFTDLVGSTELSSSLSRDVADEVRRAHFSALREAITATGGAEVKNLGDGLMVVFDAIATSLSCAVAMQQAIERYNRGLPATLAIRIGISTGDVSVEESDYFGDPVVEAARLCAVAQGGQILTTDVVKGLARRSGHNFTTERELELKGLPEPVVAWEVVWESAAAPVFGLPIPPRLPQVPAIGVVGRAGEKEILKEALKAATTGASARTVLVSGEAGVGKSTLASSFAREAYAEGAVVLYGRCDEDLVIPYRPFVGALTHLLSNADDAVLSDVGYDNLSVLARLVPDLRKRRIDLTSTTSSDPDAERWLLLGAVVALIERASAGSPIVILLDDLHWADQPTLQLLRHIVSTLVGPILVIGTYRDTELSFSHVLTETLATLTREQSVSRVPLSGLGDDEVVSFVEAASGQALDEVGMDLAHLLYRETDGNPFFVTEVLRHLVETRAIVQNDTGRWIPARQLLDAGFPESVRQVIGSRVGRLGSDAARVLSAASVIGQEFEVDLLCGMLALDEELVLDVLESAASAALVEEVRSTAGSFRFVHALIQHTLYDDLGGTRRARLHRAAAESLEELVGENPRNRAPELARHWLSSTGPTELSKAVSYARLAGETALAALAPAEAIRWYSEALSVLAEAHNDRERARCLAGLGEAQRQAGDATYRETLLAAARLALRVGDDDVLVRAALANNRGFQSGAGIVDTERVEILISAVNAIGSDDSLARCRLLALLALERTYDGDYPARRLLIDEALHMAHRLGDPSTVFDVQIRRAQAIWMADTVEELFTESSEVLALADQLGDPVSKFWAALMRYVFAIQVGDLPEVIRCQADAARIASETGQPILKWTSLFSMSWSCLLNGDIFQAEALANEARDLGTATGQPDTFAIFGVQLVIIRWHQGRLGEIVDMVVQMALENPGLSALRATAAWVLAEVGRDDEAKGLLDAETTSRFSCNEDLLVPTYLQGWARVASHLRSQDAANLLYDRLARWPNQVVFGGPAVVGAVAHNLGTLATVLDRFDDAEAHFAHALEIHERIGAPFFVALTQLEWGQMLLARRGPGDLGRSETFLRAARDIAQSRGYAGLEKLTAT